MVRIRTTIIEDDVQVMTEDEWKIIGELVGVSPAIGSGGSLCSGLVHDYLNFSNVTVVCGRERFDTSRRAPTSYNIMWTKLETTILLHSSVVQSRFVLVLIAPVICQRYSFSCRFVLRIFDITDAF